MDPQLDASGFEAEQRLRGMEDQTDKIERVNRAGESLVELVDPGGYYNKFDPTAVIELYHHAIEFCNAIAALGFIPVQLERKTDT